MNASGRLPEPLPWDEPADQQIPLFIRWEDYLDYIPRRRLDGATFVQIGANCGKNNRACAAGGDPVWAYATMCGWRGVAIEPAPRTFRALCRNYHRWPRVTPLRGAVSDRPGTDFMKIGFSETNALVRLLPRPATGSYRNVSVPVVTLSGLWAQRPDPTEPVDILAIDAEGAESLILAGPEPLPQPRPSLILFEHFHLPAAEQSNIHLRLKAQGYSLLAELKNMDPVGRNRGPVNRLYGRTRSRGRNIAS